MNDAAKKEPGQELQRDQKELRLWRLRVFASTWIAYAGYYFGRQTFYIVKRPLGEELGYGPEMLGYLGSAYLVAYTIGQFTSAALGQRMGARVLLLGGASLSLLVNVGMGFSNSFYTLMVLLVLNGFAQATGWPATVGTMGYWTTRKERGTVMGVWATCYQLGGVFAKMWASFWLAQQGWRFSFFAGAAVLLLADGIIYLWQRNKPEDVGLDELDSIKDENGASLAEEAEEKSPFTKAVIQTILLVGVFYFGVKFVRYALWSWVPFMLSSNFGVSDSQAGYVSILFDAAGFAGVLLSGWASDRFFKARRAKLAFYMLIGMTVGSGLLATVGLQSVFAFGLSLALVGFMLYGPDALLTGAGAIDIGSRRAAIVAAGVINGLGSIGSIAQEVVIPMVYDPSSGSVAPVFALLFGASALSVGAIGVVLWRNQKGVSDL
ncbi:MFS transporter [Myxococcota bacterium]|nr:MFS transporter [Myxococcota bacterium]